MTQQLHPSHSIYITLKNEIYLYRQNNSPQTCPGPIPPEPEHWLPYMANGTLQALLRV